ncbi:MAG: hypothetical protein R2699_01210 [Acidimicrobiales bacterium]
MGEAIVLTPDEKGLASDATAWGRSCCGSELLLIAIVVTVRLLRGAWARSSVWLVMTPIVVALGLLTFESVNRLLPATL